MAQTRDRSPVDIALVLHLAFLSLGCSSPSLPPSLPGAKTLGADFEGATMTGCKRNSLPSGDESQRDLPLAQSQFAGPGKAGELYQF
eukprot:2321730-Rhodomonas_salina.1